jgi:hypothetical protein
MGMQKFFLTVATITVLGAATGPSLAQSEKINWGTLGCSLSQSERLSERKQAKAAMSCKFTGINGREAHFDGVMTEIDVNSGRDAKVVYFWSVQGPRDATPVNAISGSYSGRLVAARPNAIAAADLAKAWFIGGDNREVVLQPLAAPRAGQRQTGGVEATLTLHRSTVRSSLEAHGHARG